MSVDPAHFLRGLGFGAHTPEIALVLGSGFGAIERELQGDVRAAYAEIPGFPAPAGTHGHVCRLSQGQLWGRSTLVFRGRYHAYEGHSARDLAVCVHTAHGLGARTLVVTNAAGGIRDDLRPGGLMAIADHINLMGVNPLVGPSRLEGAAPFPAMGKAYDPALVKALLKAGSQCGEPVTAGVYAAVLGPNFETAAEVEMLRRLCADAVGMSTIPEVIVARALGMRACGLSLITNRAGEADDSHDRTLAAGADNAPRLAKILQAFFEGLPVDVGGVQRA